MSLPGRSLQNTPSPNSQPQCWSLGLPDLTDFPEARQFHSVLGPWNLPWPLGILLPGNEWRKKAARGPGVWRALSNCGRMGWGKGPLCSVPPVSLRLEALESSCSTQAPIPVPFRPRVLHPGSYLPEPPPAKPWPLTLSR